MSTPAVDDKLKVTFNNDYYFKVKDNKLPWLKDDHVGSGIIQAIRDAKVKNEEKWSAKNIKTAFIAPGNLSWMIGDKLDDKAERILGYQLKKKRLAFDTYYFFHVNNEPYNENGKHWTILSIYIPKKEDSKKTVIVFNYFDSMGNAMENAIFLFIKNHVSRVLETNMKTKFNEEVTFDYKQLHSERNHIQTDRYQCGVWCIWYVHNFILQFPNPFNKSNNIISDPVEFRKLYFKVEIDLTSDKNVEESSDDVVEEVTEQTHKKEIQLKQAEQSHLQQTNPTPSKHLKRSLERIQKMTSAELKQFVKRRELQQQT